MEKFKNIYEVRKSLRFELVPINEIEIEKIDKEKIFNIDFLKKVLDYKEKLQNLLQIP